MKVLRAFVSFGAPAVRVLHETTASLLRWLATMVGGAATPALKARSRR